MSSLSAGRQVDAIVAEMTAAFDAQTVTASAVDALAERLYLAAGGDRSWAGAPVPTRRSFVGLALECERAGGAPRPAGGAL